VRKLSKQEDADFEEISKLKDEIKELRHHIDQNTQHKRSLQTKLERLEKERDEMLYSFRSELENDNSVDVMYNQHLLNLKDIEFARKEKQAEFHIKQREMYIENLKAQLAMRDQIIKDKLGASVTNFLKQDLLTMQDIEGVSQEVLLPSLKMTRSKQFNYNTDGEDNYKNHEESKYYSAKRKQRKMMGSDNSGYPLPTIQSDSSLYEDISQKHLKYIKNNRAKNLISKRGKFLFLVALCI
jgi:chromosome segregation ATPase